jgi:serine/threonine-protein kinase
MQPEKLGPYRLHRRLGRGGMGTVYAAEALDTGLEAAVKVLSAPLAREEGFRERFRAEIDALHKLKHPNIVRLYGFGEEDGTLFYAMELVDGTSLEEQLSNKRRFTWREVVQITVPLCRALRHAHDRGIIHRDIKPANLLLSREGEIKLSDFGIAKLFGASGMTADGGVIGTAEYMSPEQADGRPVTHRCDLYSLGCVMYALCAGRPPFRARSLPEMLHMQRYAEPEPLRSFAPDVPIELEQIVSELLIKDAEHRIPTALVLGRRLEAMSHGLARREQRAQLQPEVVDAPPVVLTPVTPIELDATQAPTQSADADDLGYQLRPDDPADMPTAAGTSAELPLTAVPKPGTVAPEHTARGTGPAVLTAKPVATPTQSTQVSSASVPSPTPPSRFTRVEELDAAEAAQPGPWISAQTLVLIAALAMLTAGVWYFLQPDSADALYARVARAASTDQLEDLAAAMPDIEQFLALYSADGRAAELRGYRSEVELYRLERRFQRRLRADRNDELLSPVERAYAAAVREAEFDPEQGAARLSALVNLYSGDAGLSDSGKQCLELARRQLATLEQAVARAQQRDLAEVVRQLDRADALESTEPQRAADMRRAVIELYGDKRWARELIDRARREQAGQSPEPGQPAPP